MAFCVEVRASGASGEASCLTTRADGPLFSFFGAMFVFSEADSRGDRNREARMGECLRREKRPRRKSTE